MVLSRARPEELRAIYCFATGEGVSRAMGDAGWLMLDDRAKRGAVGAVAKGGVQSKPAYVFRWTGRDWEVVFGGGRAFHLPNVLGVRYANYLLHRPNGPISAFDLEVAVSPEKGEARARNSVQPASDTRALGEDPGGTAAVAGKEKRAGGDGGLGRPGGSGQRGCGARSRAHRQRRRGRYRRAGVRQRAEGAARRPGAIEEWRPGGAGVCGASTNPPEHWIRVPLQPTGGANMALDTDATNGHGVLGSVGGNP